MFPFLIILMRSGRVILTKPICYTPSDLFDSKRCTWVTKYVLRHTRTGWALIIHNRKYFWIRFPMLVYTMADPRVLQFFVLIKSYNLSIISEREILKELLKMIRNEMISKRDHWYATELRVLIIICWRFTAGDQLKH